MIAQEALRTAAPRHRGTATPRRRVLVVEDERIVALDLRGALEDLGYAVVGTVALSDEALRTAKRAGSRIGCS